MKTHGVLRATVALTAIALLAMASIAFAKDVRVETSRARIRSGPGNYYRVVYTAYRGAKLNVVSDEKNWYKVELKNGKTGYVSKMSLGGSQTASRRAYRYDPKGRGVGTVSTGQIMAATRGVSDMGMFARQYANNHDIDPGVLEELSVKPFTEKEFRKFSSKYRSGDTSLREFSGAELEDIDYDVGAAIAMRIIATKQLSRNLELRKYVSLVGTAVADKTPLYGEEFVFILLEDNTPQSFSAPGGYVFITTGAVKRMKNEAELAGVLAHEIVHITERHGIKELERQGTRISSEKAVDDLDAEVDKLGMDTGDRDVAKDLREIADQLFEHIIGGRKRGAEDESDRLGTSLLYARGYKATGLADFLQRAGGSGASGEGRTSTYRDTTERARMIMGHIQSKGISRKRGKDFEKRFRKSAI